MQSFWYNCFLKFYRVESDLTDTLNPQNIQVFGEKTPVILEKGVVHRFLVPNVNNRFSGRTDFKLLVDKLEIPCDVNYTYDEELYEYTVKHISFKCDFDVIGGLKLYSDNKIIYYTNCVFFKDTAEDDGRKMLRVVTKHDFNRQIFDFSNVGSWFVTNLPIYEFGDYQIDADITNERVGYSSSLVTVETHLDEVVKYQVKIGGNGDYANFIQSAVTNNHFYLSGTKRTSIEAMEVEDMLSFGSLSLVNQKKSDGSNITIDEDVIFEDLKPELLSFFPPDNTSLGLTYFNSTGSLIQTVFKNRTIKKTENKQSKVKVYKNGSLLINKNNDQVFLAPLSFDINNKLSIPTDLALGVGDYVVTIDDDFVESNLGFPYKGFGDSQTWNFSITEDVNTAIITWEDGMTNIKTGLDDSVKVCLLSVDAPSGIISGKYQINGVDIADSISGCIILPLLNGVNTIKWIGVANNGTFESNVLTYNKIEIIKPTLLSVTKINNNIARFVWNNNGVDYGNGSATFQYSVDGGLNWVNVGLSDSGLVGENTFDVTSSLLTNIGNGVTVKFRVLVVGNGMSNYTNIIEKIWVSNSKIYITDVIKNNGVTIYKLHVEDADFNGYVCQRAVLGSNSRRVTASFDPFGMSGAMANISNPLSIKYELVNIPIGVYDCEISLDVIANNLDLPFNGIGSIGYSLIADYNSSIARESASYNENNE